MVACIHTHLCMQLIPSPADYAARSCPDVWKWLGRPKGLPVSGIWAPPYYFNHFCSSRLVTRSVIHRGSYNWYQSHPDLQGFSQTVVVSLANILVVMYTREKQNVRVGLLPFFFLPTHHPFLVRKCNVFNPRLKFKLGFTCSGFPQYHRLCICVCVCV